MSLFDTDDAADDLPAEAWLTALASLPNMGPRRLLAISLVFSPAEAWQAARSGSLARQPGVADRMSADPNGLATAWRQAARHIDVAERWAAHASCTVAARSSAAYPKELVDDLEPPAVVFLRGDAGCLAGPRVAVVGTRRCTRYGFDIARELGHDLAQAGVRVVSGLALGIDGAAHRGALDAGVGAAPPVAVVAGGLDIVYPKAHRGLWSEVVTAGGVIVSECPLGIQAEAWRFPARNRIIAALADAVVVVESAGKGGSMYTVEAALRRDRPVLAVPGPVRSAVSAGTNQLIYDGGQMVRDAADVLTAIGLTPPKKAPVDPREAPDADGAKVLAELGWEPATLDELVARTGLGIGPLSVALTVLEGQGWIHRRGLWLERKAAGA